MADLAREAGISGDENLLEAAQKLSSFLWRSAWQHASATLEGDADVLHDMRVAIRRLRSALQNFEGEKNAPLVIKQPLVIKHLRREMNAHRKALGKLGDALGAVRDYDVLSDYLDNYAKKVLKSPPENGLDEFRRHLMEERGVAFVKMTKRIEKTTRTNNFREEFARFALGLPAADGPNPPLKTALESLLPQRKAEVLLHAPSLDDAHDEIGQHELRKALKRLRYALELFAPGFDFPVKSRVKQITQLQDILGEMQDRTVLHAEIHAAFKASDDKLPPDVAAFVAYGNERRSQLLEQARTKWRKLNDDFISEFGEEG